MEKNEEDNNVSSLCCDSVEEVEDRSRTISPAICMPDQSIKPPSTAPNQSPTSTTTGNADLRKTNIRKEDVTSPGDCVNKCQVCSDRASGFNYGAWTCEACRIFFKRCMQNKGTYLCPATNTCTIDKSNRKCCQACRFAKCREAGMYTRYLRQSCRSTDVTKMSIQCPVLKSSGNLSNGGDSSARAQKSTIICIPDAINKLVPADRKLRTVHMIEALREAGLPNLNSDHDRSLPQTRTHLLSSIIKLAEQELVFYINWANHVPGYTELSLGDQVHLIECCWMELLLLNCAFRSMEHGGRRLVIAPGPILERPHWSVLDLTYVLEHVAAISNKLVKRNLHNDELLLLQATVLVNAELRKLASSSKLEEMRQTIFDSLNDISQRHHPDNLRHVPSLLSQRYHPDNLRHVPSLLSQRHHPDNLRHVPSLLSQRHHPDNLRHVPSLLSQRHHPDNLRHVPSLLSQRHHPDNLRHVPSLLLLLTHVGRTAERAKC